METHQMTPSSDSVRRPTAVLNMTSQSASFDQRVRSEDSWVEISSQPSSSSLSSAADDGPATVLQAPHGSHRHRRRRSLRQNRPSNLNISHRPLSAGGTSSQEEYEESESESDRVMTSSGEGPSPASHIFHRPDISPAVQSSSASEDSVPDEDEDDEDRTAINYPINNEQCFTPQPNAFSHPPSGQFRNSSQPVPGSYFPAPRPTPRPSGRHSLPTPRDNHMPQNILSPSYNAAAQHDEALRSSLTTLLSCAAAARGLSKPDAKRQNATVAAVPARSNKIEPMSLRLIPESQLPTNTTTAFPPPQFHEPTFHPTIRRDRSTSTAASSPSPERLKEVKRKAVGRASSRERRSVKKARRGTPAEDGLPLVSPTLLTWVVSAGVVVALSALSFSAGYSLGKEAGRMEAGAGGFASGDAAEVRSCVREAGRSGLGLRRSLARSAVQV